MSKWSDSNYGVSEIQEIRSGCVVEAVSQILARCILCVYKNNDDELGAADVRECRVRKFGMSRHELAGPEAGNLANFL